MKKNYTVFCCLLFAFCLLPFTAAAQNEWVLQPFIEKTGAAALQELGKNVAGFMGSFSNNPYNVAVSQVGQTGLYKIRTPNDANTPRIYFGENVVHGDFNGDRYTDYAIWKNRNFYPLDTVIVYYGNTTVIDTIGRITIVSEGQYTNFGQRMSTGDVNGDGFSDLVITASQFGSAQGKVYGYLGSPNFDSVPDFTILGDHSRSTFGVNCAIGDLNKDRFADLVIRGFDQTSPLQKNWFGYLNIYFGASQFDTIKDLTSNKSILGTAEGLSIFDCTGDAISDLLWTYRDTLLNDYKLVIHFGGTNFTERFRRSTDFVIPNPDSLRVFGVSSFGVDIANAGDMNGDGGNEIAVGTRSSNRGTSYVFVFSGGKALDATFDAAKGQALNSDFGRSVAGLGDVNGDGLSDIIVGAPDWKFMTREGYWGIFLGNRRIMTSVKVKSSPPTTFSLSQNYPNPFNAGTRVEFSLPEAGWVKVQIYDLTGTQVRSLLDSYHTTGTYAVAWDGKNNLKQLCASGVYLLNLSISAEKGGEIRTATQKMVLAR